MAKMEHVQWKKLTNPNYLGSYAFDGDKDMTLTIDYVKNDVVVGENGRKETCVVIYFKEPVKPMIANKTNLKQIQKLYKTPYIDEWHDRAITLYVDHNVRFGGEIVDGIRIRNTIPKVKVPTQKKYKCADCGAEITGAGGKSAEYVAQYTQNKYGKPLCSACAQKAAVDKTKTSEDALELSDALEDEGGSDEV